MTLENQGAEIRHICPRSFARVPGNAEAEALARLRSDEDAELLHFADELQELDGVRTELRGQLVLDRLRRLDEAGLVDVLDYLHADRLELVGGVLLQLERHRGLRL